MCDWRKYERFVAELIAREAAHDATVIPNARLKGKISGTNRQIDALIDSRFDHIGSYRVIVDAKKRSRPLHVKDVEEFEGMMRDVEAKRGILVCPKGCSPAAKRRAEQVITIRVVSLDELESFDLFAWDPCSNPKCRDGMVLWDAHPSLQINGIFHIFASSKCDRCHQFNIWCWGCGKKFSLSDEDEFYCGCSGPFFWLTAIEEDITEVNETFNTAYLLLVILTGDHFVVDRKPFR